MEYLTEKNFEEKTKNGLVVVDFFATWCGPCRMMSPILEQAQEELGDSVKIYKVDVDEEEKISRSFGIMSIPTIYIFKDGKVMERHIGLWMHDDFVNAVKKYM